MKQLPQKTIKVTPEDYSKFKYLSFNRKIKTTKKLEESYKGFLPPPIVNQHWQIIDGQHRAKFLMEKGFSFDVVVVTASELETFQLTQLMNNKGEKWTLRDWVNAYIDHNQDENYIELDKFSTEYEVDLVTAASILRNRSCVNGGSAFMIKEGIYKVFDIQKARMVMQQINELVSIVRSIANFKISLASVQRGCLAMVSHPDYNHGKMSKNLQNYPSKFHYCKCKNDYFRMLIGIFMPGIKRQQEIEFEMKLTMKDGE